MFFTRMRSHEPFDMMRVAWALAAVILMAGCTTGPTENGSSEAERTLDQPPSWQIGDWWRFEVHDFIADADYTVRVVVAGMDEDTVTLGVPLGEFPHEALHVPGVGMGPIGKADFSYDFLGETFRPIQFPLEKGTTWSTQLQGNELAAEVVEVEGLVATVEMHGPASDIYYTYDAERGQIVEFLNDHWVSYTLTDQGNGHTGALEWPIDVEHRIDQGVFATVVGSNGPETPVQNATIDAGSGYMSLFLYAGPVMLPEPAAGAPTGGYFLAEARDPTGATHAVEYGPAPQPSAATMFGLISDPEGEWRWQTVAAGTGVAAINGVTYNLASGQT